jgi:transposase-like protein
MTKNEHERDKGKPVETERREDIAKQGLSEAEIPQAARGERGENEVLERPGRRRFSAAYKLKILEEAERLSGSGQIGAMLRSEGLYSSHLDKWRTQRDCGALSGLKTKRRGPQPDESKSAKIENERLLRQNERLRKKLERAEALIEIQKKVLALLEMDEKDGSA